MCTSISFKSIIHIECPMIVYSTQYRERKEENSRTVQQRSRKLDTLQLVTRLFFAQCCPVSCSRILLLHSFLFKVFSYQLHWTDLTIIMLTTCISKLQQYKLMSKTKTYLHSTNHHIIYICVCIHTDN